MLLAGTTEAQQIAQLLSTEGRPAVASLAGATRSPRAMDVPTRVGGFGDEAGFIHYLHEVGISAVLDATHPFAARISDRAARVCGAIGLPYCQLLRPAWQPVARDCWTVVKSEEEAAIHIPIGATVFLATGRQSLGGYANLTGRHLICRVIDPPELPFPFENGEFLIGRPPFSPDNERRLFERLAVDWLVVKNSGGSASEGKLTAARALGVPVVMIARPTPPNTVRVETVAAAMEWVRKL